MAKVRERKANTVSPGALRGGMITARVSETAVGVGLGNAISEEGRKIYEKQKQYQDDIVFMDGVRAIGDRENQLLHDPKTGAYTRKGGDVRGVYESTTEELDKAAADIMKNMHPRQQVRMQEYYARRRATTQRELLKHTAAELSVFDNEQTNAFVERELETALLNWSNPELRDEAIGNAKSAISAFGVRNGKSADWIKGKHTKIEQAAHAGTIDRMIAGGDVDGAVAYMAKQENEQGMAHEDRVRIIEQMNSATILSNAQNLADNIFSPDRSRMENLRALQAATADIPGERGAKIRKAAEERINWLHNTSDADVDDQRKTISNNMVNGIDNVINQNGDLSAFLRKTTTSPEWFTLDIARKNAVRNYAEQKIAGMVVQTDWAAFTDLTRMAATNPDAFIAEDLIVWRPVLADAEYKKLVDMQADFITGKRESYEELLANESRSNDVLMELLISLEIDKPTQWSEEKAAINKEFRRRVMDHESRTQKTAPVTVLEDIAAGMAIEYEKHGWKNWAFISIFTDKPIGPEVTVEQLEKQYPDDVAKIRAAFAAIHNRAPLDSEIIAAHNEHLRREAERQRQTEAESEMPGRAYPTPGKPYSPPGQQGSDASPPKAGSGAPSSAAESDPERSTVIDWDGLSDTKNVDPEKQNDPEISKAQQDFADAHEKWQSEVDALSSNITALKELFYLTSRSGKEGRGKEMAEINKQIKKAEHELLELKDSEPVK